jgi:4'-phosphopantetheinyl transferase
MNTVKLSRRRAEVPAGEAWLGERARERRVAAGLTVAKRRADWRLGRWTAKCALGAALVLDPATVEILAAVDGAPEAWRGSQRPPVSLSISHRGGLALAAVASAPCVVGCDLELVQPRSGAAGAPCASTGATVTGRSPSGGGEPRRAG